MAKGRSSRSAISGRYISRAAAARHPRTSIVSAGSGPGKGSGRNRSAISGKFISNAAAARHPKTSVREGD
ncbi:hypothetical protein DXT87_18145 [Arthrobacter sp. AET 35A]|nr:hypothetical protein [Arthrobacter sp. AET 35A]